MGRMLEFLKEMLDGATARLPDVTQLRAFGSWGYYVDGRIFALAYAREDRVGVKLPEAAAYAAARGLPGASDWAPHGAPMSDWVLLPAGLLDDPSAVHGWVQRAFELVRAAPPEDPPVRSPRTRPTKKTADARGATTTDARPPSTKKTAAKKTAAKKTAAKKTAAKARGR